jgi:hypothetical protein
VDGIDEFLQLDAFGVAQWSWLLVPARRINVHRSHIRAVVRRLRRKGPRARLEWVLTFVDRQRGKSDFPLVFVEKGCLI